MDLIQILHGDVLEGRAYLRGKIVLVVGQFHIELFLPMNDFFMLQMQALGRF